MKSVTAILVRQPRERSCFETVQVLPQHNVDRAAKGIAARRALAVAAQKFEALDDGIRQGTQVTGRAGIRSVVDQDGRATAGLPCKKLAHDAGIQKFPVTIREDARGRGERPRVDRRRHEDDENRKRGICRCRCKRPWPAPRSGTRPLRHLDLTRCRRGGAASAVATPPVQLSETLSGPERPRIVTRCLGRLRAWKPHAVTTRAEKHRVPPPQMSRAGGGPARPGPVSRPTASRFVEPTIPNPLNRRKFCVKCACEIRDF